MPDTVLDARKCDVYGAVRAGGAGTRHKFCGQLGHTSDDETGLIYMRARYMDPVLGRFVSEDPAKSGGNWFWYANANGANVIDRNGTEGTLVETGAGSSIGAILDNIAGRIGFYLRDLTSITQRAVTSPRALQKLAELGEDPSNWRWVVTEIGGNSTGFSSVGWMKAIVCVSGRSAGAFLQMELETHGIPYAALTGLAGL